MKDKLETLESLFEETGSIWRRDIDRCKSLYGEFVKQILEASELLSLDVVQDKLELPKFGWLEESLQIRHAVEYSVENFTPGSFPEVGESTRLDEGAVQAALTERSYPTPQDDIGVQEDYSILLSDKCIQTTPLQRKRNSLSKKNLYKFLQKSNILKNGDKIYFMGDKSYDADVSQAASDLTANSTVACDDPTLYPNSSYDALSSHYETLPSNVSNVSNDPETISSSTDGSLCVETSGFKRVRANRRSLVSFLLPKKDNGGDDNKESHKDLSVCNQSNGSEISVYQSISLIANGDGSLDFTCDSNASILQGSMKEPLEPSKQIAREIAGHGTDVLEAESGIKVCDTEQMNAEVLDTESLAKEQSHKESEKINTVEEPNEAHELAAEESKSQDVEMKTDLINLHTDKVDIQSAESIELLTDSFNPEESLFAQTIKQEEVTSLDEAYNSISRQNGNESDVNDPKMQMREANKVNDEPAKLKVKRRRRRGPPLEMPKSYKPPRRDFISLFNETKTRFSKGVFYNSTFFRKEPLSTNLKQFRETKLCESVQIEKSLAEKESRVLKKRPPLFSSECDRVSDNRGFDIVQRIIWTPETTDKQNDSEKEDSVVIVNGKERGTDEDQNKPQEEILLSVRSKPKLSHRKGSYSVNLNVEVNLQNADNDTQGDGKKCLRQSKSPVVRVKGAKLHGMSLGKKEDAKENSSNAAVMEDIKSRGRNSSKSENRAEVGILRTRKKERGRTARQKSPCGDFKVKRVGRGSTAKRKVPPSKGTAEASAITRGARAKRRQPPSKGVTEITELVKHKDGDHFVFDTRAHMQAGDLDEVMRGRKGLRSGATNGRVTRNSQNLVKSSRKQTNSASRLNTPTNVSMDETTDIKCKEKNTEEILEASSREEVRESNNSRANRFKGCDRNITSSQSRVIKGKDCSIAQNQESFSDKNEINDIGSDSSKANVDNEETNAPSRQSRLRKRPNIYRINVENRVDSSLDQKSTGKSKLKSRKNPSLKSNAKMMQSKLKVSNVGIPEASGAIAETKDAVARKKPRVNRKGKDLATKDEFKVCHAEEFDKNKNRAGKAVNNIQSGELIAIDKPHDCKLIGNNCKATERRHMRVSAVPSMLIINESEEKSNVFESFDPICPTLTESPNVMTEASNEGEDLIKTDVSNESDKNSDVKKLSQSGDDAIALQRKRRGRRRNESKAKKNCIEEQLSEIVSVVDTGCKSSLDGDNNINMKGFSDINKEDVKESENEDNLSANEKSVPTTKGTASEGYAMTVTCVDDIAHNKVAKASFNGTLGGGVKDSSTGRRVGKRVNSGAKATDVVDKKRKGTRGIRLANKVQEEGDDTAAKDETQKKEERIKGNVSSNREINEDKKRNGTRGTRLANKVQEGGDDTARTDESRKKEERIKDNVSINREINEDKKGKGTRGTRLANKVQEEGDHAATIDENFIETRKREERIKDNVSSNREINEDNLKSIENMCIEKMEVQLSSLKTPDLRRSTRKKQNRSTDRAEKENKFVAPKPVEGSLVKNRPPVNKRSVGTRKEHSVPEKKRRGLFNKKNSSLLSLNFSVMQETTSMNDTQNTTMNANSMVMPQTLSNFLRSFVAPKVKKKRS